MDQPGAEPPHDPQQPAGDPPHTVNQEIRHAQVSARVPESIARGVFSTGAIVMQGSDEFVLDFLQRTGQPHQVAARIVLPPRVVPRLIQALNENLNNYRQRFGNPPPLPAPPPGTTPPTFEQVYENLKVPEDVMSGAYANTVMIGHTPSEFWFDFITNFYPKAAVSCRVFLAAPQVPRLLDTLAQSFQKFQERVAQQGKPLPPNPPEGNPDSPPPIPPQA